MKMADGGNQQKKTVLYTPYISVESKSIDDINVFQEFDGTPSRSEADRLTLVDTRVELGMVRSRWCLGNVTVGPGTTVVCGHTMYRAKAVEILKVYHEYRW